MQKRYEYLLRARDRLLQPERGAADRAIRMIQEKKRVSQLRALDALSLVIRASARGSRKRPQDRANDAAARTLVGARIPRETADRYREAAAAEGVSLYRWVCTALEEHYIECAQREEATTDGIQETLRELRNGPGEVPVVDLPGVPPPEPMDPPET